MRRCRRWTDNDRDDYSHHTRLIAMVQETLQQNPHAPVILFPEMVTATWQQSSRWIWQEMEQELKATGRSRKRLVGSGSNKSGWEAGSHIDLL